MKPRGAADITRASSTPSQKASIVCISQESEARPGGEVD